VLLRRDGGYRSVSAKVSTWMFIAVLQGGIGYLQYFNGVPELLVVMHIVGSVAMWIATLHLVLSVIEPLRGEHRLHTAETQREPRIASSPIVGA